MLGDKKLSVDGDGQEYLEFVNNKPKQEQGKPRHVRKVSLKMWSNPENISMCPVDVYKKYILWGHLISASLKIHCVLIGILLREV